MFNTTSSAPNRILAIVCKDILDPCDTDENFVEPEEPTAVSVLPPLVQSSIDDYIRQRVPPRDVPNRTDLDISEIMDCGDDQDDQDRMNSGFTVPAPRVVDSKTADKKSSKTSRKKLNSIADECGVVGPSSSSGFNRTTLRGVPRHERKARRTGVEHGVDKYKDTEIKMDGDGNCFFRLLHCFIIVGVDNQLFILVHFATACIEINQCIQN